MTFAIVFSGQGTQCPAMFPWLPDDAPLVQALSSCLAVPHWRDAAANADWAERNDIAQVLLTGLALAAWHHLAPSLDAPAAIAGYSVGELAAFSAAGVFDADTALRLARRRAAAMDRCAEGAPGGLLAASGLPAETIVRHGARHGLALAIRNGDDAIVLGGLRDDLDRAEPALQALGARCTRLRVAVASHTPLMREAATAFAEILQGERFERPATALFTNAADRVHDATQARLALSTQIAATVRWDECMEGLHSRGVDCVLEIGAGQALAHRWNARYPDVPARSCGEFRSAAGVAAWVKAQEAR